MRHGEEEGRGDAERVLRRLEMDLAVGKRDEPAHDTGFKLANASDGIKPRL